MSIWFLIFQFQIEKFNYFARQEFTLMCLQTRWALSRSIQIHRALCWQSFSQIFFCHILIQTKFKVDFFQPIHVSKILAKLAEQEKADMIMLGKVRIGLKFFWTFPISFSWQLTMTATRQHKWQLPFSIGLRYQSKLVILPQLLLSQIPGSVCLQSNKDRCWSGSSQRDWRRSGNH